MSHMTSLGGSCAASDCSGTPRIVTYTAVGGESDFTVSIGATLALDTYDVGFFGAAGVVNVPICDFPNVLAGDRTTTTFRVLTALALSAGDVLKFQIVEA